MLAASGDLANLGVSIGQMVKLVETETSQLARNLRSTVSLRSGPHPLRAILAILSPAAFDAYLAGRKNDLAEGLFRVSDRILPDSVYTSLVNYSPQFATDKVVFDLRPHGEIERRAFSSDRVLATKGHEAGPSTAFYDALLRSFRGADIEIHFENLFSPMRRMRWAVGVLNTPAERLPNYKDPTKAATCGSSRTRRIALTFSVQTSVAYPSAREIKRAPATPNFLPWLYPTTFLLQSSRLALNRQEWYGGICQLQSRWLFVSES